MEHSKKMTDIADFKADMKVLDALLAYRYVEPSEYYTRYQELYECHEFHKYVQDFPWWAPKAVREAQSGQFRYACASHRPVSGLPVID